MTESAKRACSVVDAVDFIVRHADNLTATESKGITDPILVSRTLLRRMIGKLFTGAEIRKNSADYSIRITNSEAYKALRLYNMFVREYSHSVGRMDTAIQSHLREALDPMAEIFAEFDRGVISYKFRDEDRFFVYVKFQPYIVSNRYRGTNNAERFDQGSLSSRWDTLNRIKTRLEGITLTPLCLKVYNFLVRFGPWSLGYLPRGSTRIDEAFIDFALARPAGDNLGNIYEAYATRQVVATANIPEPGVVISPSMPRASQLVTPVAQQSTEDRNSAVSPAVTLAQAAEMRAPESSQRLFSEALQRVSRSAQQEEVEATSTETAPQGNTGFTNGARLTLRRVSEFRFLSMSLLEDDNLEVPVSTEDAFMPEDEYMRLLNVVPNYAQELFQVTDYDVFDDVDVERQGVYFTLEGTEMFYLVYINNDLVLKTTDQGEAVRKYNESGLRFEEIKYLEESTDA